MDLNKSFASIFLPAKKCGRIKFPLQFFAILKSKSLHSMGKLTDNSFLSCTSLHPLFISRPVITRLDLSKWAFSALEGIFSSPFQQSLYLWLQPSTQGAFLLHCFLLSYDVIKTSREPSLQLLKCTATCNILILLWPFPWIWRGQVRSSPV